MYGAPRTASVSNMDRGAVLGSYKDERTGPPVLLFKKLRPRQSWGMRKSVSSRVGLGAMVAGMLVLGAASLAGAESKTGPERWESAIAAFEKSDKENPPPKGGVLFVGSSSIRKWTTLAEDFPGQQTINRGFGGSEVSDSLHFANRIVLPYEPRMIVMYAGDNDISHGKPAKEVSADFQKFVKKVKEKLPKTRIAFIAIKPSLKRWELAGEMIKANAMIKKRCDKNKLLDYLDVWAPMLGKDGKPRSALFLEDGLHLNAEGYALWTSIIRPFVNKN